MTKWMNTISVGVMLDDEEDDGNTFDDNSSHNEDNSSSHDRDDDNECDNDNEMTIDDELDGWKPAGQVDKVELSNSEVLLLVNPLYHGSSSSSSSSLGPLYSLPSLKIMMTTFSLHSTVMVKMAWLRLLAWFI